MSKGFGEQDDTGLARLNKGTVWFLAVVAVVALLLCVVWAPRQGSDGYVLTHSYVGEDFFSKWSFFVGPDPTKGTVKFLSFEEATAQGLIHASFDRVYMGSDASEVLGPTEGRKTVRIESNEWFRNGLIVLDIDHAPVGCGTWPAFWMFGEDAQHAWPRWGEYDILESVHNRTQSATTLHTRSDCDQTDVQSHVDFSEGWVAGKYGTKAKDCFVKAPNEFTNQGCGQNQPYGSFGRPLNQAGGATWAAEWDPEKEYIRTWFFPRGKAPRDLLEKRPVPATWGKPASFFSLKQDDCNARHFRRMRMVFDITFCGDFGGGTFAQSCPNAGMSCPEYVQKNPKVFSEAFWSIGTLDVYKKLSEQEGVTDVPVGPYDPYPSPCISCRAFGMLFLMLGLIGCGAIFYFLHKKATSEDMTFVEVQKDGLATFSASLQMNDVSQCTNIDLQNLQQAEFATQIREGLPTMPQVGSWFQGTPRPQVSHPQRNAGATQQFAEQGAVNRAGYYNQPTRGASSPGVAPAGASPTGTAAAGIPFMTSWWQDRQPMSTRQPSLGRTSSTSSVQHQVCAWPQNPQSYRGAGTQPQQGSVMAATQAGAGGWSNWAFGAAQAYAATPASPTHSASSWSLPPTINALGPGAQRRT